MSRRWLIALPIGLVVTVALFVGVMELMGWGNPSRLVYSVVGGVTEADQTIVGHEAHLGIKINEEAIVNIACKCLSPPPPQLMPWPPYESGESPVDQSDLDKLLAEPQRPRSVSWILLNGPAPEFPHVHLQHGGYAVVQYTISELGKTRNIEVVETSHPAFGHTATRAVRDWRFIPRRHDGKPVASENVTMRMEFRIGKRN